MGLDDIVLLSLAGTGLLAAGVIKGATGLGYASCALPFLVPVLGLERAIAVVVTPALVSNLQIVLTTGHAIEMLHRFRWFYAAMLPGIAAGLWALKAVDPSWTLRCLGVVIIGFCLVSLLRPDFSIGARTEQRLAIPFGTLNGFLTGFTGSQVLPLLPFMMGLGLPREAFVQAVNLSVAIASTILAAGLIIGGIVTTEIVPYALAAVLPAIIGVTLGGFARRHIPETHFRQAVLAVLLLFGASFLL